MTQPPRDARWSEGIDPELPSELFDLLRGGRASLGTSDEVAELARRLSAVLGPASGLPSGGQPAPPSAASPAAPRGTGALGAAGRGVWALGGAAVALGFAAWLLARGPSAPSAPSSSTTPVAVRATSSADAAPSGESAPPGPVTSTEASEGAVVSPPPAPSASSAEVVPRAKARTARRRATGDAVAETTLLEQARAALRGRPATALELTHRHRARFPEGALAEEREVIAIEALERLGRKQAARARAAEFERRYRGSVHQPRLLRGADTSAPAGGALNTAPP